MCLRSWKRMSGRSALESKGLKERVISSWRLTGMTTRVVNTSPLSSYSPASFILSSSWVLRCLLKELFASSGSLMDLAIDRYISRYPPESSCVAD